jgi:hypothetical protein
MPALDAATSRIWTVEELRAMAPIQRDSILRMAAELAETDYALDHDLTDFEAFGEEDADGTDPVPQPG